MPLKRAMAQTLSLSGLIGGQGPLILGLVYSGSQAFQGNAGLCDHAPASVPHEDIGKVERTTQGRGPINSTSYADAYALCSS